jgi:hypothetical protein
MSCAIAAVESTKKKKTTKYFINSFKTLKVIKGIEYFVVSYYNYKKINNEC